MERTSKPPINLFGGVVGLKSLTGLQFDPSKPYCGCRICGRLFQGSLDKLDNPTDAQKVQGMQRRAEWTRRHAKLHPYHEHVTLALSGLWCTPEAAEIMAPFGIIPLTDTVMGDETTHALREARRAPQDDTEA